MKDLLVCFGRSPCHCVENEIRLWFAAGNLGTGNKAWTMGRLTPD